MDETKALAPKQYLSPRKWFIYFKFYWYNFILIQHKVTGFLIGNCNFTCVGCGGRQNNSPLKTFAS